MLSEDLRHFVEQASEEVRETQAIANPWALLEWLRDFRRQVRDLERTADAVGPRDCLSDKLDLAVFAFDTWMCGGAVPPETWLEALGYLAETAGPLAELERRPALRSAEIVDLAEIRGRRTDDGCRERERCFFEEAGVEVRAAPLPSPPRDPLDGGAA